GTLLLAGSGEFLPPMAEVDVELLRLTPGRPPSVAILPTAAGQELTVQSWIDDGVRHFTRLGCRAYGVPVVDRAGADNPDYAAALGALPNLGVIPHSDRLTRLSPERLAPLLELAPPGLVVFGIDENTVLLLHGSVARVLGHGTVTRWRDRQPQLFKPGDSLPRA